MKIPSLYEHQQAVVNDVRTALRQHDGVILTVPPGTGKTRMAKHISGLSLQRSLNNQQTGNILFVVYGRALVDNASNSFGEDPYLPHGVAMAGREKDWSKSLTVGSIDTILNWFTEGDSEAKTTTYTSKRTYDLIIYDECHTHHPKLTRFVNAHSAARSEHGLRPAKIIGLSATPYAPGLADIYGTIVTGPTANWLTDNGYLAPFKYFRAETGDVLNVKRSSTGEFTEQSVADAMVGLSGELVRDWKLYGQGRPTVGFFPRLAHAKAAMEELRAAGVRAAYVDGEVKDEERQRLFRDLGAGHYDYLCNVGVVERGSDIPAVSCIQLATIIGTVVRFKQMVGRGSRTSTGTGKTDCIVIDHGQNTKRLGYFTDETPWSLDISKADLSEGARPSMECPRCKNIYRGGQCANCNYEPKQVERASQNLEWDGVELKEVSPTGKQQEKPKVRSNEKIMTQALYMAGKSNKTFGQAVHIARKLAPRYGVNNFKVPDSVTIGGRQLKMIRHGDRDSKRKVKHLYPVIK